MDVDLRERLMSGKTSTCPACEQTVKLYKRKITRTMASQLRSLYDRGPMTPKELYKAVPGGEQLQVNKLHHWGLLILSTKTEDGKYQVTEKGRQFVRGEIAVAKILFVYNDKVEGEGGGTVTFDDCFGEEFDKPEALNVMEDCP